MFCFFFRLFTSRLLKLRWKKKSNGQIYWKIDTKIVMFNVVVFFLPPSMNEYIHNWCENDGGVVIWHKIPRFGHTNNFFRIISPLTPVTTANYVRKNYATSFLLLLFAIYAFYKANEEKKNEERIGVESYAKYNILSTFWNKNQSRVRALTQSWAYSFRKWCDNMKMQACK